MCVSLKARHLGNLRSPDQLSAVSWQDCTLQASCCGGAWIVCVGGKRMFVSVCTRKQRGAGALGAHIHRHEQPVTLTNWWVCWSSTQLMVLLLAQLLEWYTLYNQVSICRPPPWPTGEGKVTGLLVLPVVSRSVGVHVRPVVYRCCVCAYWEYILSLASCWTWGSTLSERKRQN